MSTIHQQQPTIMGTIAHTVTTTQTTQPTSSATASAAAAPAPPAPVTAADITAINDALNTALRRFPPRGPGGPGGLGGPEGPGGPGGPGTPGGGQPRQPPAAQLIPITLAADLRTMGIGPRIFDGDRQMADAFYRELTSYMQVNEGVPGFESPMRRIAMALTYIKGPKVDGWADDMATWLDGLDPAIANVEYTWE
jgi:hypothetical protein